MNIDQNMVTKVSAYVIHLLTQHLPSYLHFHNLSHTKDVVNAVGEIGNTQQLSKNDLEIIEIAAWFHDTGYCKAYVGHEEESKKIAFDFLGFEGYPKPKIEAIMTLIESTKYPQKPTNLFEMILCDADLFHLSCEDYDKHEQRLRIEWEEFFNKNYSDKEWAKENCEMLHLHQYFTDYGKTILQEKKEININKMQCRF
ncbi:HD domain-containing protein [Pedobacter cryophilus]|uniref:HD domain-containing protein n=1 Tax=Pedobacter cryophilus TaxID=2571271 RepID=A0A4U1C317_9SPHI|nr:HD domain-containing protein [Pedobacter cryophilus]TKB97584.1 HD domain-containing protein [Pedobacter cryophilus]